MTSLGVVRGELVEPPLQCARNVELLRPVSYSSSLIPRLVSDWVESFVWEMARLTRPR
jgi:hypothetical protein